MGACCSKEGKYGSYKNEQAECEDGCEEEDMPITRRECGASVRLQGSSDYISMATQQGKKGTNQDSMTVWEDLTGEKEVYFCGVFDGHGPSGHEVSRQARDQLPLKLSAAKKQLNTPQRSLSDVDAFYDYYDDEDDDKTTGSDYADANEDFDIDYSLYSWKACFLKSFKEVDKELSLDASIDSYCSGTTAVTLVKQGDNLIIGNLGDSRAVMGTRGEGGEMIPVQLTVDLKPSLFQEAERVKRCNGRVFSLSEEPQVLRLWLPDEDCPGLAMTRAFGDFCLKDCGLIAIPQVFFRKLTPQDEFVVLATDGVWDVLTNYEVVKIVSAARTRSKAAEFLVAHAVRAWKTRFPSSRQDDIAVVCLFFKPPPPQSFMSSDMSDVSWDSLGHLNSSVASQCTQRTAGSYRSKLKNLSDEIPEDWGDKETLVDSSMNIPRHPKARRKTRSRSRKSKELWRI